MQLSESAVNGVNPAGKLVLMTRCTVSYVVRKSLLFRFAVEVIGGVVTRVVIFGHVCVSIVMLLCEGDWSRLHPLRGRECTCMHGRSCWYLECLQKSVAYGTCVHC